MDSNGQFDIQPPLEVYTNSAKVEVSVYDLRFVFGIVGGVDRQLVVHMSPQHALATKFLLDKFLDFYQANIGPINLPEDLVKSLQEPVIGELTTFEDVENTESEGLNE